MQVDPVAGALIDPNQYNGYLYAGADLVNATDTSGRLSAETFSRLAGVFKQFERARTVAEFVADFQKPDVQRALIATVADFASSAVCETALAALAPETGAADLAASLLCSYFGTAVGSLVEGSDF